MIVMALCVESILELKCTGTREPVRKLFSERKKLKIDFTITTHSD